MFAVSLRCTVQRLNYAELPALVRLGQALGVEQVSFLAVDVSTHVEPARATFDCIRPTSTPRMKIVSDDSPVAGSWAGA